MISSTCTLRNTENKDGSWSEAENCGGDLQNSTAFLYLVSTKQSQKKSKNQGRKATTKSHEKESKKCQKVIFEIKKSRHPMSCSDLLDAFFTNKPTLIR